MDERIIDNAITGVNQRRRDSIAQQARDIVMAISSFQLKIKEYEEQIKKERAKLKSLAYENLDQNTILGDD